MGKPLFINPKYDPMKNLLLFVLFSISMPLFAQDPCKHVKKEIRELQGETSYSTNFVWPGLIMSVSKTFKSGGYVYALVASTNSSVRLPFSAKGLFIKFENGEIEKYEQAPVTSSLNTSSSKISYSVYSSIIINKDLVEKMASNKIIKIGLYDIEMDIKPKLSEALIDVVTCLNSKTE